MERLTLPLQDLCVDFRLVRCKRGGGECGAAPPQHLPCPTEFMLPQPRRPHAGCMRGSPEPQGPQTPGPWGHPQGPQGGRWGPPWGSQNETAPPPRGGRPSTPAYACAHDDDSLRRSRRSCLDWRSRSGAALPCAWRLLGAAAPGRPAQRPRPRMTVGMRHATAARR
eukprot:366301-Chlamydomonas_euryale.AAC.11